MKNLQKIAICQAKMYSDHKIIDQELQIIKIITKHYCTSEKWLKVLNINAKPQNRV